MIAKALDGMIRDVLDRGWHATGTTTDPSGGEHGVESGPHPD